MRQKLLHFTGKSKVVGLHAELKKKEEKPKKDYTQDCMSLVVETQGLSMAYVNKPEKESRPKIITLKDHAANFKNVEGKIE